MYLQWDCYAICVHKIVIKFNFASLIQGQFWNQKNVQYFSFYDSPAALQDRILSTLLPLLGSPQLTGAVKLVPGTEPSPSRVLVTSSTLVLVVVTMLLLLLALVPGPPSSPRIRHHPLLPVPVLSSAVKRSIGSTTGCTITEKAPTRAFSWLKAPASAFTFKTLC